MCKISKTEQHFEACEAEGGQHLLSGLQSKSAAPFLSRILLLCVEDQMSLARTPGMQNPPPPPPPPQGADGQCCLLCVQGFELEPNDWLPYKALKHNEALARWEQARK